MEPVSALLGIIAFSASVIKLTTSISKSVADRSAYREAVAEIERELRSLNVLLVEIQSLHGVAWTGRFPESAPQIRETLRQCDEYLRSHQTRMGRLSRHFHDPDLPNIRDQLASRNRELLQQMMYLSHISINDLKALARDMHRTLQDLMQYMPTPGDLASSSSTLREEYIGDILPKATYNDISIPRPMARRSPDLHALDNVQEEGAEGGSSNVAMSSSPRAGRSPRFGWRESSPAPSSPNTFRRPGSVPSTPAAMDVPAWPGAGFNVSSGPTDLGPPLAGDLATAPLSPSSEGSRRQSVEDFGLYIRSGVSSAAPSIRTTITQPDSRTPSLAGGASVGEGSTVTLIWDNKTSTARDVILRHIETESGRTTATSIWWQDANSKSIITHALPENTVTYTPVPSTSTAPQSKLLNLSFLPLEAKHPFMKIDMAEITSNELHIPKYQFKTQQQQKNFERIVLGRASVEYFKGIKIVSNNFETIKVMVKVWRHISPLQEATISFVVTSTHAKARSNTVAPPSLANYEIPIRYFEPQPTITKSKDGVCVHLRVNSSRRGSHSPSGSMARRPSTNSIASSSSQAGDGSQSLYLAEPVYPSAESRRDIGGIEKLDIVLATSQATQNFLKACRTACDPMTSMQPPQDSQATPNNQHREAAENSFILPGPLCGQPQRSELGSLVAFNSGTRNERAGSVISDVDPLEQR